VHSLTAEREGVNRLAPGAALRSQALSVVLAWPDKEIVSALSELATDGADTIDAYSAALNSACELLHQRAVEHQRQRERIVALIEENRELRDRLLERTAA
jgi:hypothetical protein